MKKRDPPAKQILVHIDPYVTHEFRVTCIRLSHSDKPEISKNMELAMIDYIEKNKELPPCKIVSNIIGR